MEDYVLIGSVLEATHMGNFEPKAKHIKRYELQIDRIGKAKDNQRQFTLIYGKENRKSHAGTQNLKRPIQSHCERRKIKTRVILDHDEKLYHCETGKKVDQFVDQFFFKKLIEPKSSRQHSSRYGHLARNHQTHQCLFYDIKFDQVEKRQRECLITPEGGKRRRRTKKVSLAVNQGDKMQNCINIRDFIKKQWEEQERKKHIQSRTGAHLARKKAFLQKQTNQNLKTQEYEQLVPCKQLQMRKNCPEFGSKTTRPMNQEQIKTNTINIMHKYGVNTSKIYFKCYGS